jgi:hypothetical protein
VFHAYHPVSILLVGILVLVIATFKRKASFCIIQSFSTHGETALPIGPVLREAYISILSYLILDSNGIDQSHLSSQQHRQPIQEQHDQPTECHCLDSCQFEIISIPIQVLLTKFTRMQGSSIHLKLQLVQED